VCDNCVESKKEMCQCSIELLHKDETSKQQITSHTEKSRVPVTWYDENRTAIICTHLVFLMFQNDY